MFKEQFYFVTRSILLRPQDLNSMYVAYEQCGLKISFFMGLFFTELIFSVKQSFSHENSIQTRTCSTSSKSQYKQNSVWGNAMPVLAMKLKRCVFW